MTEQLSDSADHDSFVEERPAWWRHFEGRDMPDIHFRTLPLPAFLDQAAEHYGSRKAIRFQNMSMTYRELRERAEALAAGLRLRGVSEGDRVAIMLPNLPQTIIALWGVLKAGAVAVMTNPLYMEKELTHHFNDARAKVLITMDLLWNKVEKLLPELPLEWCLITRVADGLAFPLNLLQPWKARREGGVPEIPFDGQKIVRWSDVLSTRERYSAVISDPEHTPALLQYTGGTTGFAKAAILTHQNLSAQMQIIQAIVGGDAASKNYIFLSIMPFFHVLGLVGNIMVPALYAGTSIPVPRYTPGDLLRTIVKYKTNFFIGAPSIYISLMQQKDIANYDLSCIDLCISGSAPFPKEAFQRFQELTGAHITEGFGLTEASPCVAANPLYGLQKIGSIGTALPATELRIVDLETGMITLGDNQPGELIVRGPQVMQGYWNRPDETASTLRNGWLYTGDIAYRDEDGYYFIVDRKKDMAIVGGYNVYPREVDEVLYEYPKVAEAVAVSVPHKTRGETLKAYIVPKDGETITAAELIAHCRSKLANYKIPRFFEFRTELPKNLVGKVLRRVLRAEEEARLREKVDELRGQAEEMMDKARKQAGEMVGKAREQMEELRGQAEEMMDKARRQAGEMVDKAREQANELHKQAEEVLEKARKHAETLRMQAEDIMSRAQKKAAELRSQEQSRPEKTSAAAQDKATTAAFEDTSEKRKETL